MLPTYFSPFNTFFFLTISSTFFFFQLFTLQSHLLTALVMKPFENTEGIGENASNQHFLLFQHCFLPFPKEISIFQSHLLCHQQVPSILDQSKYLFFGKDFIKKTFLVKHSVQGHKVGCMTHKFKF